MPLDFGQSIVRFRNAPLDQRKEMAVDGTGVETQNNRPTVLPVRCHGQVFQRLNWTMEAMSSYEWAGLFGMEVRDRRFVLTDFRFPEQIGNSVEVGFRDPNESRNERAIIHSHPNGPYGFSSTDQQHVNSNFDVSMLAAGRPERTEFLANIRPLVTDDTIFQAHAPISVVNLQPVSRSVRENWKEMVLNRHEKGRPSKDQRVVSEG